MLRGLPLCALILSGCRCLPSGTIAQSPETTAHVDIDDAVFGHGNSHFYFLPPMVPSAKYSCTPEGTLERTPTQLTNLDFYTRAPAASPDGQRVAIYSDIGRPAAQT